MRLRKFMGTEPPAEPPPAAEGETEEERRKRLLRERAAKNPTNLKAVGSMAEDEKNRRKRAMDEAFE